jgi:hypothetical protein
VPKLKHFKLLNIPGNDWRNYKIGDCFSYSDDGIDIAIFFKSKKVFTRTRGWTERMVSKGDIALLQIKTLNLPIWF